MFSSLFVEVDILNFVLFDLELDMVGLKEENLDFVDYLNLSMKDLKNLELKDFDFYLLGFHNQFGLCPFI